MTYQTPPQAIVDLLDAPPTPMAWASPDGAHVLLIERRALPPIADLAQPEVGLAGLRLNPRSGAPSRSIYASRLSLLGLADGKQRPILGPPDGARITSASFAPDGARLAFAVSGDDGVALWLADVATARAHRLTEPRLSTATGSSCIWLSDGSGVICRMFPADRGPAPQGSPVPSGPVISENAGKVAAARTYRDLLRNADDEDLLDHLLVTQVVRVARDGTVTPIGVPGTHLAVVPSPSGAYFLVETLHRPYSYSLPLDRFPRRYDVWDATGEVVRTIHDAPLSDTVSTRDDAVRTGPRMLRWRAEAEHSVCWVEARDGGDPQAAADVRDEVMCLADPTAAAPTPMIQLGLRFERLTFGPGGIALVTESWFDTRRTRTWLLEPGAAPRVLFDRSYEDRYHDPGAPMTRPDRRGQNLLAMDGGGLLLDGAGATPEGNLPFVDRLDLATGRTERLWRAEAPIYETAVDLIDDHRVLTRRESVELPPQYAVRDLHAGTSALLTDFPNPSGPLGKIGKQLIHYQRGDGVKLSGTLYTPAGWTPADGPLPLLLWVYPSEYKDAAAAGQVHGSPLHFDRVTSGSPLFALTQGYAVLDDPSMPIVGEGTVEPNDSYVQQLVADAQAAVDEVVRLGVADADRIAVGGHSYGAFTTANLLAHTRLFRAGIAESGAYNRSLTPFGFQSEQRTYWDAPEVYNTMSPFAQARNIRDPLLLIHGQLDNNPGTFPVQSERLYDALKGLGATVRLVMLPYEQHGYRARESVLHHVWEKLGWLDRYVKHAGPRP